jgi:hypothetical protein
MQPTLSPALPPERRAAAAVLLGIDLALGEATVEDVERVGRARPAAARVPRPVSRSQPQPHGPKRRKAKKTRKRKTNQPSGKKTTHQPGPFQSAVGSRAAKGCIGDLQDAVDSHLIK